MKYMTGRGWQEMMECGGSFMAVGRTDTAWAEDTPVMASWELSEAMGNPKDASRQGRDAAA